MSSTRANLALDEQAFQGLLAAAFTIQEHNDRRKRGYPGIPIEQLLQKATEAETPLPPATASEAGATAETTLPAQAALSEEAPLPAEEVVSDNADEGKTCAQCGGFLPDDTSSCPICHPNNLRPGERLQRSWASLWQMSQEQDRANSRSPFGKNGRTTDEADGVSQVLVGGTAGELRHLDAGNSSLRTTADAALDVPEETALPELGETGVYEVDEAIADEGEATGDVSPVASGVRLRFHRADIYLGLAILVALVALFWPTMGAEKPALPTWERMLVAVGIADAPVPAPPVVNHGDPNLKVWIDPHAALYYCPGDELYGKSADGRYSTQREAQADRFEPAEGSVCVE